MIIAGIILLAIGALLLFLRGKSQAQLLDIKFVKTSAISDVVDMQQSVASEIGPGGFRQQVELKGQCSTDAPLRAELSGQECVYYSMTVSERYEERYTETDSSGNTQQKTRTGTTVVTSNTQSVPFTLTDATGSILVEPDGASIDARSVVNRYDPHQQGMTALQFGSFSFQLGGIGGGGRRILGYEYRESIIPTGQQLYILGDAADAGGTLSVRLPQEKGKPYIVSIKSEEELTRGKESAVLWLLIGAVASFVAGAGLIVAGALR